MFSDRFKLCLVKFVKIAENIIRSGWVCYYKENRRRQDIKTFCTNNKYPANPNGTSVLALFNVIISGCAFDELSRSCGHFAVVYIHYNNARSYSHRLCDDNIIHSLWFSRPPLITIVLDSKVLMHIPIYHGIRTLS